MLAYGTWGGACVLRYQADRRHLLGFDDTRGVEPTWNGASLRVDSSGVSNHVHRNNRMPNNTRETRYRFAVWNLASACSQYRSW